MAADTLLLDQSLVPTLRLYSWSRPSVSLGYSQSRAPQTHLPVVRRPSGGRALLHNQELTYSVTLPETAANWSIADAFECLTHGLGAALARLGIDVHPATSSMTVSDKASCMALQQRGELHSRRGKLVGSAQVRRGTRLLQHGVIPWRVDRELLESVFPDHPPVWGVEDLGYARFSPQDLARSLGQVWDVEWTDKGWTERELQAIEAGAP
jgi:lipoate-protein ligase A